MAGLEGRTLGRYRIKQLIGRGGMADVYLADDTAFDRRVAVKVFKREDEDMLRRFIREAQLMGNLSNPHLMPIYDTGESVIDGLSHYYITMPFMDGGTLRARIRRAPIPLSESCYYMRAIADALDYVHAQGIIHRDIKSSNVLLSSDGACYLADFGIARMTNETTQLTSTGNVLGTVDYVAPELFEPHRRADALSDLYSLGVLLYELVTRRLPFSAENQIALVSMHMNSQPPSPRVYVPALPPQVEQVVLRALAKQPQQRYQSASALAEAFCQAIPEQGASGSSGVNENEVLAGGIGGIGGNRGVPYMQDERLAPLAELANAPTSAVPQRGVRSNAPSAGQAPAVANRQAATLPRTSARRVRRRATPEQARARAVTIIALVVLLAVIGPIIYVATHPNLGKNSTPTAPTSRQSAIAAGATTAVGASSPTPNLTGTAQAVANATQQAKNATATAIVGVTATAQAQVKATAGVIQTATTGTTLYQDPLTDGTSANVQAAQWDQTGNCVFKQDGYHITVGTDAFDKGQIQGCREDANTYQNFTASVDMSILSGHSGGVFFRVGLKTLGAYSGYLFEVDSQGNYKISASGNFSTGAGNAILQPWTATKALKTGTGTNTLQLIARGNGDLLFYANGSFLISMNDTTFTQGKLAFLASSTNGGANTEVVYNNLKITALP